MTYEEFIEGIKSTLFPDREALNLSQVHSKYILDGLIWLQKRCPELQDIHYDLHDFGETLFDCCSTAIPKPDGVIKRVYTYTRDDGCDAVFYHPVTPEAFHSNVRAALACGSCVPADKTEEGGYYPDPYIYGEWAPGGRPASEEQNKGYRATQGVWTIRNRELLVFPAIESTEKLGVHWSGVKLRYDPDDMIEIPIDVQTVIEIYVKMQIALREDCDENEYLKYKRELDDHAGELVWWYRNKSLTPEIDWRGDVCDPCRIGVAMEGEGGGPTEPCPPCPDCPPIIPPPVVTFTIYLGNAGEEIPPPASYTEAQILAMENGAFGITTVRTMLAGFYQIEAPASTHNEWRLILIPASVHAGQIVFKSSGFNFPMAELAQMTVNGIPYRVFRSGVESAGAYTFVYGSEITIIPA